MWVSFLGIRPTDKEQLMPALEELISVLLPILPDAEVGEDNDGQIVIYTGLRMPDTQACRYKTRR
jgi:hypothetical protein